MTDFIAKAVLKRDVFSETQKGYLAGEPDKVVIRRIVTASPIWTRPLAWILARREIAALRPYHAWVTHYTRTQTWASSA